MTIAAETITAPVRIDRPDSDDVPDAMAFLRANAAALAPPGGNAQAVAMHGWSVAHGLAMLMLDGQIPADDSTIDAVVDGELGAHTVERPAARKPRRRGKA